MTLREGLMVCVYVFGAIAVLSDAEKLYRLSLLIFLLTIAIAVLP